MPLIRGRGLEQFSESKSPPYRGVASAARTSSAFEIQLELDHGRRVWRLGRNNWIWRLSDDVAAR
jgi:hypothetical protein